MIRVYTLQGIEVLAISMEKPVVTIAGYENQLAVVYHSSIPLLGHQSLHVRVYNMFTYEKITDAELPLTPYSKLAWFGYSEEGCLYTQDSKGYVRTMLKDIWMPVYEESEGAKLWIIGISDNEMRAIKLAQDEFEPNPLSKLNARTFKLKPVLVNNFYGGLLGKKLNVEQAVYRKDNYGYLKEAGNLRNDDKAVIRQGIKDDRQVRSLNLDVDKSRVDFVRNLILEEEFEKAMYVACQIESEQLFQKCLKLVDGMGHKQLAKRIAEVHNEIGMSKYLKVNKVSTQVVPIEVLDQVLVQNSIVSNMNQSNNSFGGAVTLDRPNPKTMNMSNFIGDTGAKTQNTGEQRSFAFLRDEAKEDVNKYDKVQEDINDAEIRLLNQKYSGSSNPTNNLSVNQNTQNINTYKAPAGLGNLRGGDIVKSNGAFDNNRLKRASPAKDIFSELGAIAEEPEKRQNKRVYN